MYLSQFLTSGLDLCSHRAGGRGQWHPRLLWLMMWSGENLPHTCAIASEVVSGSWGLTWFCTILFAKKYMCVNMRGNELSANYQNQQAVSALLFSSCLLSFSFLCSVSFPFTVSLYPSSFLSPSSSFCQHPQCSNRITIDCSSILPGAFGLVEVQEGGTPHRQLGAVKCGLWCPIKPARLSSVQLSVPAPPA